MARGARGENEEPLVDCPFQAVRIKFQLTLFCDTTLCEQLKWWWNAVYLKAFYKSKQNIQGYYCLLFILYIYFLHLFILQAIYIVLQDLKMKMLFVE